MNRIARLALLCVLLPGCAPTLRLTSSSAIRRDLFAALTPVRLSNCSLKRYGDARDGGYLLCENLMSEAQAAYSFGIDGRDQWGCDVSRQLRIAVHEYDCFNLTQPLCEGGRFVFHEECVAGTQKTVDGRIYDTMTHQIIRNADAEKHLIVKMDVEGDEWSTLLEAPEAVFERIDQLAIEFHGTNRRTFVATLEKLKRYFYVAHFHANNNACNQRLRPFTSRANEVLLVNKRIAVLDMSGAKPVLPNALDSPNSEGREDCQPAF